MAEQLIRINKYLSEQGVCSRREADDYIKKGEVTIDGRVAYVGEKVSGAERICLRGKEVGKKAPPPLYIALYKPAGVVCTTKNDAHNVIDYLHLEQRVFPVGRLDKDSTGLLLLTNDGSIVNEMMRSSAHHEKEYIVQVDRVITPEFLKSMSHGIFLEDLHVFTRPCTVKKIKSDTFSIVLTQGLNRQIRRMCETLGYQVLSLKRIRILNICLGDLPYGKWRNLTTEEVRELKRELKEKPAHEHEREEQPECE